LQSLIENRRSLHQQVTESRLYTESLEEQLLQLQPLANLGLAWAMTAHELNNLLTPIVTYSQLALQYPEDTELSEKALKKAERLSTQAGQILEKVLSLANSAASEKTTANLSVMIEDVFDSLARDFSKDKIKVEVNIDRKVSVLAETNALRQVLMNLILNAHHAMSQRGGTLRIDGSEDNRFTWIEIEDTGFGIEPEKLRDIFKPFFTKGKKNGNGLGLAYCQKVIESHGGCISAESEVGRGTRFKIVLPKS
jgi:signal transduction histidine kinase